VPLDPAKNVVPPLPRTAHLGDSESEQHGKQLRRLLFISFGWLLALLIGAGVDALLSLRHLDRAAQEVGRRFTARNRALGTIVVSVRVYDDQIERFLLQDQLQTSGPDPSDVANKIAAVRFALLRFPIDGDSDEQVLLASMRQQLQEEENSCAVVLAWRADLRRQRAYQFIGQEIGRAHV
jgi:hypothetical protein